MSVYPPQSAPHDPPLRRHRIALLVARGAFVATLTALPLSTAATNVFVAIGLLGWMFSGRPAVAWRLLRKEPAVTIAVALFAFMALSMLWSVGPLHDQLGALDKFRKLLLIPVVASLFDDVAWQRRALAGFAAALLLTLVLSLGSVASGFEFPIAREFGLAHNAVVFKQHITQNWMMSLFAFGCLSAAVFVPATQPHARAWRLGLGLVGALALVDIFGFVLGRTGQVTTLLLLGLWWVLLAGWRGVLLAALSLALLTWALLSTESAFKQRFELAVVEFGQSEQGQAQRGNSIGERMAFWTNSAKLILHSPWIGYGVGSTKTVYRPLAEGQTGARAIVAWNPHDEYMNLTLQAGIGAAALFLALLALLARCAHTAGGFTRWFGLGFVLLMLASCVLNSSLWDFNEGHTFALLSGGLIAAARRFRAA